MIRSKSIPNKVWKFVHYEEEWIMTNITGREINLDRLVVEESGKIIIRCSPEKRYAWDGCTPKWEIGGVESAGMFAKDDTERAGSAGPHHI